MTFKNLYILVCDCGDGSYHPKYTMNEEWIKLQEELDDKDELDYDALGVDGDGFHYDVIQVPLDATYESLGISNYRIADL